MVSRRIFRSRTFRLCFFAGIGGVIPDATYVPGIIQGTAWSHFLHDPVAVICVLGVFIACCAGLGAALLLKKHENIYKKSSSGY